jgi:hypothetical protein
MALLFINSILLSLSNLPKLWLSCFGHIVYSASLTCRIPFVDSAKIRFLLAEWFQPRPGAALNSADEDYAEAAQAIRALKSLFQSELERREGHRAQNSDNDRTQ